MTGVKVDNVKLHYIIRNYWEIKAVGVRERIGAERRDASVQFELPFVIRLEPEVAACRVDVYVVNVYEERRQRRQKDEERQLLLRKTIDLDPVAKGHGGQRDPGQQHSVESVIFAADFSGKKGAEDQGSQTCER